MVTRVLERAGADRLSALAFVADMAQAAMRQLPHDGTEGLMWLYQVESAAKTRTAREREDDE